MNVLSHKSFRILFFILVIAELVCSSISDLSSLHYVTKPAIVIALLLFFVKHSQTQTRFIKRNTILALVFSWLGDVLLMFVETSPHFFTLGLVAFLLAHVMYIRVFLKHRNPRKSPIAFILIMVLYAVGMFYFLREGLGSMLVPVLVYMTVILSMSTSAYLRKGMVNSASYNWVLMGAFLFMLSDSILALNKFYQPLPYSNISIMLTYALAQYSIVLGILKLKNTNV